MTWFRWVVLSSNTVTAQLKAVTDQSTESSRREFAGRWSTVTVQWCWLTWTEQSVSEWVSEWPVCAVSASMSCRWSAGFCSRSIACPTHTHTHTKRTELTCDYCRVVKLAWPLHALTIDWPLTDHWRLTTDWTRSTNRQWGQVGHCRYSPCRYSPAARSNK